VNFSANALQRNLPELEVSLQNADDGCESY